MYLCVTRRTLFHLALKIARRTSPSSWILEWIKGHAKSLAWLVPDHIHWPEHLRSRLIEAGKPRALCLGLVIRCPGRCESPQRVDASCISARDLPVSSRATTCGGSPDQTTITRPCQGTTSSLSATRTEVTSALTRTSA